jgi:hypothetical protein
MARSKKSAKKTQQSNVSTTVTAGKQKFACYIRRGIKVNQHDRKPRNKVFCYEVG